MQEPLISSITHKLIPRRKKNEHNIDLFPTMACAAAHRCPHSISAQVRGQVQALMDWIETAYQQGPWTELDIRLRDVHWQAKNVMSWPLDAFCVYHDTKQTCYIGSLKSATAILDIEKIYGDRPNCVVSMCGATEMDGCGALDWEQYMASVGVQHHIRLHVDDVIAKKEEDFYVYSERWLKAWENMTASLSQARMCLEARGMRLNVLFHCWGGVNRGPAAAVAWLIACGATPEGGIGFLLEQRKALRPWKRRAYVVYSFFVWEHQRASETDASAETADAR